MSMAFTVYFELVNLAEETHRVRLLRQRRRAQYNEPGGLPMRESIGSALRELKARNVPTETVQALLDKLSIELVFTAHPTESKRRTMLNKLQRLSQRRLLKQVFEQKLTAFPKTCWETLETIGKPKNLAKRTDLERRITEVIKTADVGLQCGCPDPAKLVIVNVYRGCGSHAGQISENLIEQAVEGYPKQGVMRCPRW